MRVKTEQIGKVLALKYIYDVSDDMGFEFFTLAEVGEPWQEEAKEEATRTAVFWGLNIVHGVEIDQAPWIVDILVDIKG